MDIIDNAQEREEFFRDQALAARERPSPHMKSLSECLDCDEPIPVARREAVPGCTRCVACQSVKED